MRTDDSYDRNLGPILPSFGADKYDALQYPMIPDELPTKSCLTPVGVANLVLVLAAIGIVSLGVLLKSINDFNIFTFLLCFVLGFCSLTAAMLAVHVHADARENKKDRC